MNTIKRSSRILLVLLGVIALGGVATLVRLQFFGPTTLFAEFASATAIYSGDDVRVAGVKVGTIEEMHADGAIVRMTMKIDSGIDIPEDARAVIVAQNLLAPRYVQLTPAYADEGPTMPAGSTIPLQRTAIPVEWDQVKQQLMRLATDLGPQSGAEGTAVSRFLDSASAAMAGNGDRFRQTLAQLSELGRTLGGGGQDIASVLQNLQTFVSALRASNDQIVQFQGEFATLTSVLDNSRTDLDAVLKDLSIAVGDIHDFVANTGPQASEQVARLTEVTQNLVEHRIDLENVLHVAPNAIANQMNIYNPDDGAPVGAFVLPNMSNPLAFICGNIGAIQNATAPETAKLCAQYLGPALQSLNFNYLPIPFSPFLAPAPSPDKVIYSEPRLAPGGEGPKPQLPERAPAVSAYTGNNDVPPPAGYGPPPPPLPVSPPQGLAPPAGSLPEMLLPAEAGGRP
ncbi:MCE family protein [Mycobacterium sp. 236(2023)]|uniref:MCE family protein n=1 Tax=Mycobacterium sp. 236(2023) TaxID=3038163 RepID=UPI0024152EE0|nr:MCE family protein [Mycobacterium sp. 236(2023)]MDG4667921.1 MCE family protein [Mycobacterium sp. 236(2023)]